MLLIAGGGGYTQTIILKQSVPESLEDDDDDFGPNRKFFSHPYTGIGFVVGGYDHESDTLPPVKFGNSFSFVTGTRYYRNYNPFIARVLDYEIGYEQHSLNFSKDHDIGIPVDNADIKKAKYWLVKVGLAWSYQFNFKVKRGNQLGTYLSIGAYGDYLLFRRFTASYESRQSNYADNIKIALSKIDFFNKWDYGALVRFGKTNWSLFAKYRYANYFNDKASENSIKELPRFIVGLNFFPGNI
ncbi:PorT family protein [Parvicella tangerina]|nr:PorT family protein [Parvicella tangerina]